MAILLDIIQQINMFCLMKTCLSDTVLNSSVNAIRHLQKRILVFCMLCSSMSCFALSFSPSVNYNLLVSSQKDFDQLNLTLNHELKTLQNSSAGTINIIFKNGFYRFNDANAIRLATINFPLLTLNFVVQHQGQVTLISDGQMFGKSQIVDKTKTHNILELNGKYDWSDVFLDKNFHRIPLGDTGYLSSSMINHACSQIIIVDSAKKIAKIAIPPELNMLKNKKSDFFARSMIFYKAWFISKYGKVLYSDNTYLYFQYDSLYVINGDYKFSGHFPAFYITNIPQAIEDDKVSVLGDSLYIPQKTSISYLCHFHTLMVCNHVDLKQLRFSGFRVSGSSLSDNSALMTFNHCRNITISNNIFAGIGNKEILSFHSSNNGYPLRETSTSSNILIINNKVLDCYGGFVGSSAWNTCIKGNDCKNLATFYEFGSIIGVAAKNYEVSNNKICNYGSYTGISIGDSRLANHTVSGVIEYNQIYFTPDFKNHYERNTLMDGGGIYLITHQDSTICRYNIIHDIKGRKDYRGIFCDDGAYNFQLIGNLVYNIDGTAIESRYVSWNSKSNSIGYANNINNIMRYNIIMGTYKFEGNPAYPNSCKNGPNYINSGVHATVRNVKQLSSDVQGGSALNFAKKYHLPKFIQSNLTKTK